MSTAIQETLLPEKELDRIIARHRDKPGALLSMLEEAQQQNPAQYLPAATLEAIARKTRTPLSRIYSVVTFYAFFNLKAQGKHTITFCQGTACHTRGSKDLFEYAKLILGIGPAGPDEDENEPVTTPDNLFTLRKVACFGQCALAPAVSLGTQIHGHVTKEQLQKIIRGIKAS